MNFRLLLLIALTGGGKLFFTSSGRSQTAPLTPQTVPPLQPTTTVETGDLGGKYFGAAPDPAKTRRYYIAAEPELWDYAPQGKDVICGMPLPPHVIARRRGPKLRYVQYTDDTFRAKVMSSPQLGIMGPALRGVVGETLAVTFLNRGDRPLSMHPHGVKYDKDSEGAYLEPNPGRGAAVARGAKFTYVWQLDEQSGPLPGEPSSKGWLYHSHVSGDEEAQLGLIGTIIVTDPQRARADGTPSDVDREMATLFMIFDESGVGAAAKEAAEYGNAAGNSPLRKSWIETQQLLEQGMRFAINGYIYGNLPGLEMNEGERVRWYLFALGDEVDMHTAHWHGLRVIGEGRRRTDVIELLPASMKVADMQADNPGTWLFHCHVAEHMQGGMFSKVIVHPRGSSGVSRAPHVTFLGLRQGADSLRLGRAEVTLGPRNSCEIRLSGKVTVFNAFSVFAVPIRLQLGKQIVNLQPATDGTATAEGATYRVLNSGRFGVVYEGVMEWEATLTGEMWRSALEMAGLTEKSTAAALPISFQMNVGEAVHTTMAQVIVRKK